MLMALNNEGGRMTNVKQFIEPCNLTYNMGSKFCQHYMRFPYRNLVAGVSIVNIRDRHSEEHAGVFRRPSIVDCGMCYYVISLWLEKEYGEMVKIEGRVIDTQKPYTPSYVKSQLTAPVSPSLIMRGYDLYFDGVVDFHEIGRIKTKVLGDRT